MYCSNAAKYTLLQEFENVFYKIIHNIFTRGFHELSICTILSLRNGTLLREGKVFSTSLF